MIRGAVIAGRGPVVPLQIRGPDGSGKEKRGPAPFCVAGTGDVVTCEIAIQKDANRGALLDGHIEFPGGRTGIATVKKNNIFRVGGE